MARKIYASDINRQMQKIRKNVASRAYIDLNEVRQAFGRIIYEEQEERYAPIYSRVMPYGEALERYKKATGSNFRIEDFTKEQYQKEISLLVAKLKSENRWTQQGEKDKQIEKMKNVLSDEYGDLDIDYEKDYGKLKEAFERVKNHIHSGCSREESGGEYIDALTKAYKDILAGR